MVIPIAGRGSRMASSFGCPKPLIEIEGATLFEWSTSWLKGKSDLNVIIVALAEHEKEVLEVVARSLPNAKCVLIEDVTEGQLCSVLCAKAHLDRGVGTLVIPCDTFIDGFPWFDGSLHDGAILLSQKPGDRWSFALVEEDWIVTQVAEKRRISEWVSTGHYYFRNSEKFIADAAEMIAENHRVRGEFYIMPLYQRMIDKGARIQGIAIDRMVDLGSPEGIREFQDLFVAKKIPSFRMPEA